MHTPFSYQRARSFQNTVTIETGISDFHNMVITVLEFYTKSKNRKSFNAGAIMNTNMHAPKTQKFIRANNCN